jgi:predicted ester cyclase
MGELTQLIKQHHRNVSQGHIECDRDLISDDIIHISATAGTVTGIEAFLAFVTAFKQAFPDLHWEIREFMEGSDTVVAEGVFVGTNSGTMVGPGGPFQLLADGLNFHFVTSGRCAMGESLRIVFTMIRSLS